MVVNFCVVHLKETKACISYVQKLIQKNPRAGFWSVSAAAFCMSAFLTNGTHSPFHHLLYRQPCHSPSRPLPLDPDPASRQMVPACCSSNPFSAHSHLLRAIQQTAATATLKRQHCRNLLSKTSSSLASAWEIRKTLPQPQPQPQPLLLPAPSRPARTSTLRSSPATAQTVAVAPTAAAAAAAPTSSSARVTPSTFC